MTTKVPYSMLDSDVTASIRDALFPVGSVALRMDAINPGVFYGGTWTLIEGDASLAFGDGTPQAGAPYGVNDIVPTLLAHWHTGSTGIDNANHTHAAGGLTFNGVTQEGSVNIGAEYRDSGNPVGVFGSNTVEGGRNDGGVGTGGTRINLQMTPTGTIVGSTEGVSNTHTHGIEPEGDSALMNIRGARININVWLRTA